MVLFFLFRKALRSTRTRFSQSKQRRAELKALRAAQLAADERVTVF